MSLNVCQNLAFEEEDEAEPKLSPKQPKTTSGAFTFRLRVALRSTSTQQPSDEEEEEEKEEDDEEDGDGGKDRRKHVSQAKGVRRDKFKDELAEAPVIPASLPQDRGSDSAEDVPDSFLKRREQNIKANKAMVNH